MGESRIERAAEHVAAVEIDGGKWAYYAPETQRWYKLSYDALEALCDYLDSGDEQIRIDAYSHWRNATPSREMPEGWEPGERVDPPHVRWLCKEAACAPGIGFASKYPTLKAAWDACEDLDHLTWVAITGVEVASGVCSKGLDRESRLTLFGPIYRARDCAEDQADETGEDPCDLFRAVVECPVIEGE